VYLSVIILTIIIGKINIVVHIFFQIFIIFQVSYYLIFPKNVGRYLMDLTLEWSLLNRMMYCSVGGYFWRNDKSCAFIFLPQQ